jgi:hypothetical protein
MSRASPFAFIATVAVSGETLHLSCYELSTTELQVFASDFERAATELRRLQIRAVEQR